MRRGPTLMIGGKEQVKYGFTKKPKLYHKLDCPEFDGKKIVYEKYIVKKKKIKPCPVCNPVF